MTVTATLDGHHIRLDAHGLKVAWPATPERCVALREEYGDELQVSPKLSQWFREARKAPKVERWAPALWEAMQRRPYQITGAREIARIGNVGVLDEGGLGKTAQSFAGLMESDNWVGRHLVICPKTAATTTWARQIREWSPGKVWVAVGTAAQKRKAIQGFLADHDGARFLVTNPETIRTRVEKFCAKCERWVDKAPKVIDQAHVGQNHRTSWKIYQQDFREIFDIEWSSVIADEVDRYMLGLRPQTGKMTLVGEGLTRLQAQQKIAMTGTPFRGAEHNIFGILHWLDPKYHKAYWTFIDRFFEVEVNQFGDRMIGGIRSEMGADFGALVDRYFIRRTRAEVRDDLPENLHIVHWVDMSPRQGLQYRAFEKMGFVRMNDDVLQGLGVLAELTRLKQMAFGAFDLRAKTLTPIDSPKFDLLVDMLHERGVTSKGPTFGVMKYIVASQFTDQLDWMQDQLHSMRIPTLKITGSVTGKARDEAKNAFSSEGGPRVLLLNTRVASSMDLDAWCDEMFIMDETFVEDDQEQLRWRIDNRGERTAVRVYHYLRTADSIDQRLAEDNLSQAEMQNALLDGRRGIEVAKRLIGRDK